MKAIERVTTPAADTIRPTREEVRAYAVEHTVIPVWAELVADQVTPIAAFTRLAGTEGAAFLLESATNGEQWSRWSFVGAQPAALLRSFQGEISVSGIKLDPSVRLDAGVLATVEDIVAHYRSPSIPELPPLHGGLVGYLGYDVVREVERLPSVPFDDQEYPDALLQMVGDMAAIDHFGQRVFLISNVIVPASATEREVDRLYSRAVARVQRMAVALATEGTPEPLMPPPRADDEPPEVTSSMGGTRYTSAVEEAKEHILEGDIFQVVLSQRFDFELGADPFDVYRVLRQLNPSPYMYYVRTNRVTLVGSSPEPLVQVLGDQVISRPIAGTRRRGSTDEEDRRLAAELVEHPKEVAEHIMLVDLARNDLGRVVSFGTERVDETMSLERYSHVMHLTSQVSGRLAPGKTAVDVLRATMPAGTVTGAPKVRAMEIIDELEPVKRGPYAGVVGYLDFSGNLDTAIAIRTMVVGSRGQASVQAGAGVVADSVPEHEDLECHNKARALLAAVPAARRMSRQRLEYSRASALGPRTYAAIALKESAARVRLKRDLLIVTGADAAQFLQGQLSQDVLGMPEGASRWSLVLQPDGKWLALVRVSHAREGYYTIDTDLGRGAEVVERLRRFLIRVDCTITDAAATPMIGIRGPDAATVMATIPPLEGITTERFAGWPSVEGYDLLGDVRRVPSSIPAAPAPAFQALRIEAGWPITGVDIMPGDVPADAGQHVIEAAVSFEKGCYTGQELVERMDARGAGAPRPLRGLILNEGSPLPPAGAEVHVGGDVVGTVTSAAEAPWRDGPVALCRTSRAAVTPAVGYVRWPDGEAGARLVDLPMAAAPSFDRLPSV